MPGGGDPGPVVALASVGWNAELIKAAGGLVADESPEGIGDFVRRNPIAAEPRATTAPIPRMIPSCLPDLAGGVGA